MTKTLIIDGDWGGDEMQLAAVLLAHPDDVTVVGATAVFGNTGHDHVLKNAGDVLSFLNAPEVPYCPGARGPTGAAPPEGDNAHGADGIGGVTLQLAASSPQADNASDFILATLRREPVGTVTITATGPLTNIARAIAADPETMARVAQIVIMGGCTTEIPAADMPSRKGNITADAEFNFYMAAADARAVLSSGLPVILFPMNCTQQLTLTTEREQAIRTGLAANLTVANAVVAMMSAPAELDRTKFNSAPVMHDVHTALYLLHPELYEGRRGYVDVTVGGSARGRTDFRPDENGPLLVMEQVKDPDQLFACVLDSLKICLLPQPGPNPRLGCASPAPTGGPL